MFNCNFAAAAPRIFSLRLHAPASIAEFLRSVLRRWSARQRRRREREELYAFLASDHRIAADIGYRHHERE